MFEWANDMNCAVTVCDADGVVVFMNEKSKATFNKNGETMMGKNLYPCHSGQSQEKIREMLAKGTSNAYTIEKNGQKKMIYQTPWRVDGIIKGLVEISMVIPQDMPHYVRG